MKGLWRATLIVGSKTINWMHALLETHNNGKIMVERYTPGGRHGCKNKEEKMKGGGDVEEG